MPSFFIGCREVAPELIAVRHNAHSLFKVHTMGYAAQNLVMSSAEFLAWELEQAERHEFVDGEIFAMAGADDRHVTTSGNMYMALRRHLAGSPCRTYMSDMRVNVAASGSYFYPDVVVTCSAADKRNQRVKSEPTLVVEVLSPSTEAFDRGLKFVQYQSLPSLREYVVVDVDARVVEVHRVNADGLWVLHRFAQGETLHLASVALDVTAEQLFAELDPIDSIDDF
jgi:Uma2 family endonuclease